jgi:hypothetical protein
MAARRGMMLVIRIARRDMDHERASMYLRTGVACN